MRILFVSISSLPHMSEHSISLDLIHCLQNMGHEVSVICALEKRENRDTYLAEENGCRVLRVRIGNNKRAGLIEKGLTTLLLPRYYVSAIKKYFSDVRFDMVVYPTTPVTQYATVRYVKKRDGAKSFLLLKDIFPQNALDLGMMSKGGLKGIIYRYFRRKEKRLYAISDRIGCMSQANVDYLLRHNPEIPSEKVGICPNAIEPLDMRISSEERRALRDKYQLPQDKKIFVYGGNLGKPQGIPFLLDCLRKLSADKDAYFLIVGDGTEYGRIEAVLTAESIPNARLMRRLPKEDYDRLTAACDIGLIFLDHRFTIPNFPSRLLAYMQAGLPVLAATDPNTDVGTVIAQNGFGFWCESNDAEAFANAARSACKLTPDELSEMQAKEKNCLLENYSAERCARIVCGDEK